MLRNKMKQLSSQHQIPDWVASYTKSTGSPSLREVVAKFYARFITQCEINPEHLAFSAGATSVIDLTSWILGEPGDVVVIPAPCYPVYKQDMQNKSGLERYDLVTHHDIEEIANGPLLTTSHLEEALRAIESEGKRFRILVITNPDNPTGGMFDQTNLEKISDWCINHQVHLIVNEIYCLSLIDTLHPELKDDYNQPLAFYSFINIMQQKQSEYLHHWYALSKDFGSSGFRVGMVCSFNKTFMEAYNNLNAPSMVSNYAQWIFELVLSDHDFIEEYIQTNQKLLTENYLTVIKTLKELKVPYAPARGSLFVWLDLSSFLKEQTQESESEFWLMLYTETGILLTPGNGFGHSKKGQFRLVHSCFPKKDLEVAMERLIGFIQNKRRI